MKNIDIDPVYQQVLDGTLKQFPKGTWSNDPQRNIGKKATKYLVEKVLNINIYEQDETSKYNLESVKHLADIWTFRFIRKYKLGGLNKNIYNSSPYKQLIDAYPNILKEWELRGIPLNYWTEENSLEALKWTIEEKENLTREELLKVYSWDWLRSYKLDVPLKLYWKNNYFTFLDTLYPSRFKEWELITPRNYWTKERGKEAFIWLIESKLKINKKDIEHTFDTNLIMNSPLVTPFQKIWSGSPYNVINDVYPGEFEKVSRKSFRLIKKTKS